MSAPRIDAVAVVWLREPLRKLTGGAGRHELVGETVAELLQALERAHPLVEGWILDERGRLRRHINVYVDGEPAGEGTPVRPGDRVDVVPAITGG
jgi:molybdopterin synthase sulfur carrier subunit